MRKILPLLTLIVLASCAGAQKDNKITHTQLDGEVDYVALKDLIFAEQTVLEINQIIEDSIKQRDPSWEHFATIEQSIKDDKSAAAIEQSLQALADSSLGSRQKLWLCNQLRALGHKASEEVVYGLILEVPQQNTLEYLAIYDDHGARYINYTGKVGVWEVPEDSAMNELIDKTLDQSKQYLEISNFLLPGRNKNPTYKVRFNFLTNQGIKQTSMTFEELDDPSNQLSNIFLSGAQVLMRIVEEMEKQ
ncbi:MAG: hypothetical protein AAFV95_10220 [Bacteroidota bacterium]